MKKEPTLPSGQEDWPAIPARTKKKLPAWVILPILAVLLLLFLLLSKFLKPAETVASFPVTLASRDSLTEEYTISGTVESERQVIFYSPVNAPIASCTAVTGQTVKEGDLLITFDTSQLEQNNQQSQLNLEVTRAGNQSTLEQAAQSASLAAQSQAQLESQIADTRNKINEKQAEVDALAAQTEQETQMLGAAAAQTAEQAAQLDTQIAQLDAQAADLRGRLDANQASQNTLAAQLDTLKMQLSSAWASGSNAAGSPGPEQTALFSAPSAPDGAEGTASPAETSSLPETSASGSAGDSADGGGPAASGDASAQDDAAQLQQQIADCNTQLAALKNEALQLQAQHDQTLQSREGLAAQRAALSQQSADLVQSGGAAQQLAAAQAELQSLQAALDQLTSTPASQAASITDGQRKSMELQENLAELSTRSAQELVELGRSGIRASFSGVISDVQASPGSQAVQGQPLFTLVSNTEVNVRLEVPTGDFSKLKTGMKAEITVGAYVYSGTLASIDKIAVQNVKGNPVVGASIHIDDPDDNLCIGVPAKVKLQVAEVSDVLCIPNELINTGTDGDFVYVIREGRVKKQLLELGISSGSLVEVKNGLRAEDEILTDTGSTVKEGMRAVGIVSAQAPGKD